MDADISHLSRLLRSKDPRMKVAGGAIALFAMLPWIIGPTESPEIDRWVGRIQNAAWFAITLTALAIKPDEERSPELDEEQQGEATVKPE